MGSGSSKKKQAENSGPPIGIINTHAQSQPQPQPQPQPQTVPNLEKKKTLEASSLRKSSEKKPSPEPPSLEQKVDPNKTISIGEETAKDFNFSPVLNAMPKSMNDVEVLRQSSARSGFMRSHVSENKRGPCLVPKDISANKIYFDESEIKRLEVKFSQIDTDQKREITPAQLGNLTELMTHVFRERIVQLAEDKLIAEGKTRLQFDDFLHILSIFSQKCPMEFKTRYLYRLYDINGDGFIDQKDLFGMLQFIFFVKEITEKGAENNFQADLTSEKFIEGMARDMITVFDLDNDLRLDINEFRSMLMDGDVEARMNITF